MSYTPPNVSAAGLVVSNYLDILNDNLDAVRNIFGQNQYLGVDSQLYQLISILSLKQADQNAALQLVYNQTSPQTAVGAGMDRVLKLNGLARLPFSYSTCPVICSGPGTTVVITNGYAQDVNGNLWQLPPTVTIGSSGSVTVTATCTTPGNIVAEPGQISIRATPTAGWTGVTNAVASTPGVPVESDSEARARQAISVARPALTTLDSTVAAVLAVD